jgi:hypothetical protein
MLMITRLVLALKFGDGWSCANIPAQTSAAKTTRNAQLDILAIL